MNKHPIFVLGCPRSGTSLMRRILNAHSHIACPGESAFLVQLSRIVEVNRSLEGLHAMGASRRDVLDQMQRFTRHFFDRHAAAKNKPRWADKSCSYLNHAETIREMFDGEVVFVGITRHVLSVAHSLCQFDWSRDFSSVRPFSPTGQADPVAAARFWMEQNGKLMDFFDGMGGRMHLIRYEALTADPEPVLRGLFDFLDEPWEPEVLSYNAFAHDQGAEDAKVGQFERIEKNSSAYRAWPEETIDQVCRTAEPMLHRIGYGPRPL